MLTDLGWGMGALVGLFALFQPTAIDCVISALTRLVPRGITVIFEVLASLTV
ncbi:hypothetical protein FORC17_p043 (plasmid) [Vibrio vulnificus]|nr:hypothetical protein FORC17_p043 [Vibrio vulnificus]